MEPGTASASAMTSYTMTQLLMRCLDSTIMKATVVPSKKLTKHINAIAASPQYPAYNSGVCWAGYINVKTKALACDYYDAVAAGILGKIRQHHDKPAYDFSAKTLNKHSDEFMFWGPKQANYAPVENKQAMATVCWLGQMLLGYGSPRTRFTQVLSSKGENLTLCSLTETGETPRLRRGHRPESHSFAGEN